MILNMFYKKCIGFLFALVFLFIPFVKIIAQETGKANILLEKLNNAEDSEKIEILNNISMEFFYNNKSKFEIYNEQAIDLSIKYQNMQQLTVALNNKAKFVFTNMNNADAKKLFLKAYSISKENNFDTMMYKTAANIATLYRHTQQFDSALLYYKVALTIGDSTNNMYERSSLLKDIGMTYYTKNEIDSALLYYKKAIALLSKKNNNNEIAALYNKSGSALYSRGLYNKSIEQYKKALNFIRKNKNTELYVRVKLNLILAFYEMKKYEPAIYEMNNLMQLVDSLNRKEYKAQAIHIFADIFLSLGRQTDAMYYYNDALDVYKNLNDSLKIAQIFANIGSVYKVEEKYDSALVYYEKAMQFFENKPQYVSDKSLIMINIGEILLDNGEHHKAMDCFTRAANSNLLSNNTIGMAKANYYIGKIYVAKADYKNALQYTKQALEKALLTDDKQLLAGICLLNSQIYENKGNINKALLFYKKYNEYNQHIFKDDYQKQLAILQTEYEMQKKQNKIELLNTRQKLNKTKIKKQKQLIISLITGLIMLVVLSSLIVFQYLRKREAYKQLVSKNMIIDNQREQVEQLVRKPNTEISSNDTDKEPEKDVYQQINDNLYDLFDNQKIYLDKNLTQEELAKKAGTNRTYLNEVLRNFWNTNFTTLVNQNRIAEARKLLLNNKYRHISIEGIAQNAGFKSKSAFYTAFKKYSGVTPSDFIKYSQQKSGNLPADA